MNAVTTVVAGTKTLDDIKADMSELYNELRAGRIQREDADALANIAGKFIRADALQFAREVFAENLARRQITNG